MKRKILMALGCLALIATPVLAAGLWPNLPIVGGAAYCQSFVVNPLTGAVTTTCNGPTTAAGPLSLTGNELIPADTRLSQGRTPQSVLITMAALNALPMSYTTLSKTAASNALSPTALDGGVVIISTAALSATTVQLPPNPVDGQQFRLSSTQNIATLTVNSADASISNAPTALTTSTTLPYGYSFRYRNADDTWYRLQ